MNENINYNVPKEKLVFANANRNIHDKELATKPVGYFKDAFNRFKKNKGSIIAAFIILILVLYAIIAPIFSPYSVAYSDGHYKYVLPKSNISEQLNIDFWDGCSNKEISKENFIYYYSMMVETGHDVIKDGEFSTFTVVNGRKESIKYKVRLDSYHAVGMYLTNTMLQEEYFAIQKYQDETGIQVIYPITDSNKRPTATQDQNDGNFWFETEKDGTKTKAVVTENPDGTFTFNNIYKEYSNGSDDYTSKVRFEGENNYLYDYAYKTVSINEKTNVTSITYEVRYNYYEYYKFYHSYYLKDGIKEPMFLFGCTSGGQDIFTCLASGARFSFVMAIIVALVNLIVGAIYGAIEGYYGGKVDLIMERIVEILSAVPFMIVITLLKYHMESTPQVLILFIAYFLTGWIGMAGRTRMQFYRFKNQEYVLAARTLGARDFRIMFKHIFPNALGTLITGSVLVIPGMIFSETSLSYLGIINLNSGNMTSVGTLLANAQGRMTDYPHMMVFPAVFISLLMLSFNLFGNGLRDAFNPSLRGTEE